MKKLLFLLALIFCLNGKAQFWQWVNSASGTGFEEGFAVSADTLGNVYAIGYFGTPAITFGTYTLTNPGINTNLCIAKYDVNGNLLWAKSSTGIGQNLGLSISADNKGNFFISGAFDSTITLGTYTFSVAGPYQKAFIAKYDANGNVLWAKSYGSGTTNNVIGNAVSADAAGNVFFTGYFGTPTITFGTYTLTNNSYASVFVTKYDSNGNVLWAKSAGGSANSDIAYALSTDAFGNVFITGNFQSPTITFGTYTLTNTGINNIFIAKYNANGNVLWAKRAGGTTGNNVSNAITTDALGNVFITGGFQSSTITFDNYTLTNAATAYGSVFIIKYDSVGNVLWSKSGGTAGNNVGTAISADGHGNVFVAGGFPNGTIVFDTDTLTAPDVYPMFIIKYDSNGNILCASALASGGEHICGLNADRFGNAYIVSDFMINSLIVGSTILPLTGEKNIFVAKCSFNCENNLMQIAQTIQNVGCVSVLGSATVTPSGGEPPYTVSWNTTPPQIGNVAVNLSQGTYLATITDNSLIQQTKVDTVVVTFETLKIQTSTTNVFCNGLSTGTATVTVTNGTAPYTYLWQTGQTTSTVSDLAAGTYTVEVTDATTCSIIDSFTITQAPTLTASFSSTNIKCNGDTASVKVNAIGGINSYTFLWNTNVAANQINGVTAGVYTVTISDSAQCTKAATYTLMQPTALTATILKPDCKNESSAYLKVTASGGTIPYAYSWSTNPIQITDSIYNLNPGNYSLTVTDANLCAKSFSENIYLNFQIFETVNVFTPNGDTKNEVFFPFAYGNSSIDILTTSIDNYELYIYDLWGKKVFYSTQATNTWDGKEINGSTCPDGVYYWIVTINSKCQNASTQTFKGFVHLDR